MHGPTEREIALNVPFQRTHFVTLATESLDEIGVVINLVEDDEPVPGRCLRIGPICPELS